MSHVSNEDAINFVNQVMSVKERAKVQEHLQSGCKRCENTVATWQSVRQTISAESDYQPPAGVLRIVKAAFASARFSKAPKGLKLLFDSILQPAAVGFRSSPSETRQLLYGVGPYLLDLYISAKAGGKMICVTGQLMNSRFPEKILNAVPILVGNGTGSVLLATTNKFGEFQTEIEYCGDLELRLPSAEGREIVIRLGCLLSGLAALDAGSSSASEMPRI